MDKTDKPSDWLIRAAPKAMRRHVSIYAATYGLNTTEALTELVEYAYEAHKKREDKGK